MVFPGLVYAFVSLPSSFLFQKRREKTGGCFELNGVTSGDRYHKEVVSRKHPSEFRHFEIKTKIEEMMFGYDFLFFSLFFLNKKKDSKNKNKNKTTTTDGK